MAEKVMRIVDAESWKFNQQDSLESITQCINVICTTPMGSVTLDRNFGIDLSVLDLPIESCMAMLRVNIMEAIEAYEPRAEVTSISFEETKPDEIAYFGRIIPVIRFIEKEES